MVDPRDFFDESREAGPIRWHAPSSSWLVTRFADVWDLLVDPRLGARSQEVFTRKMTPQQRASCALLIDFAARWPIFLDPPEHTMQRRLLLPVFSAQHGNRVAEVVRASALNNASGDWRNDDPLATLVQPACQAGLAALLGLAVADVAQLAAWSREIIAFISQTGFDSDVVCRAGIALEQFTAFVVESCTESGNSLLGRTLWRALRTGKLTEPDAVAIYAQIVTGAIEPTTSALATALELLTGQPDLRTCFATDPQVFLAETIRLTTPFHFAPRRALTTMNLHGSAITAGDRVVLLLIAANRDPRRFTDPLAFRMDRGQPPHVAFGRGRHACLGASLSMSMMRSVLEVVSGLLETGGPVLKAQWSADLGMRIVQRLVPTPT